MDKVIIDGVNVSECEHYRAEIETKMPYGEYEIKKDKCHYSGIEVIQNCKGNKGCIYKQLKRLEAENFELKESLKVFQRPDITKILTLYKVGDIELLEQKCDKLQAENERLKEELRVAQMNRMTMFEKLDIVNEKDTYKQALQEIKEICKNSHTSASEDYYRTADKIQDKINEVIGK